jgi:hypothetical protein
VHIEVTKGTVRHYVEKFCCLLVTLGVNMLDLERPDILGVIIGVIGIILAVVFYWRTKETVRPVYAAQGSVLLGASAGGLPSSVEIRYDGMVIPTLYKYRVTFWNDGKRTLNGTDIAPSDPVRFHLSKPSARVLDVRSISVTRKVLNIAVTRNEDYVQLSFDFLDRGDGVTFEMFYSAKDEGVRISSSGTIKGAKQGISRRLNIVEAKREVSSRLPFPFPFLFKMMPTNLMMPLTAASVISLAISVISFITIIHAKNAHTATDWNTFAFAIFTAIFGCLGVAEVSFFYYQSHVPRGLRRLATSDQLPNGPVTPKQRT